MVGLRLHAAIARRSIFFQFPQKNAGNEVGRACVLRYTWVTTEAIKNQPRSTQIDTNDTALDWTG